MITDRKRTIDNALEDVVNKAIASGDFSKLSHIQLKEALAKLSEGSNDWHIVKKLLGEES